jgi:N utilization substance protein A
MNSLPALVLALLVTISLVLCLIAMNWWGRFSPRPPQNHLDSSPEPIARGDIDESLVREAELQQVRRAFENEIPEVASGLVEIHASARSAGTRTKVAVRSSDPGVDCIGVCVGESGERIRAIVEELGGERIDIVLFSDNEVVFVENALQPLEIEELILCPRVGRMFAVIPSDQRPLAGELGNNHVQLASALTGWEILVFTEENLHLTLDRAISNLAMLPAMNEARAQALVEQGILAPSDVLRMSRRDLMDIGGFSETEADELITAGKDTSSKGKNRNDSMREIR